MPSVTVNTIFQRRACTWQDLPEMTLKETQFWSFSARCWRALAAENSCLTIMRMTTPGLQLGLLAAVPPHTSQQPVSRLLLNSFREAAPVSWISTSTRGTTLCRSMIQIKFDEILTANYFHHACGLTANLCKFIVRCAPFFADLERMKQRWPLE